MTRGRRLAAIVLGACALASCGFTMDDHAAAVLATGAANVRAATQSGDRANAEAALADLRAKVDELVASGALDEGRAQDILAAALQVESELDLMPTTTTTTRPPVVEGPGPGHGKGKKDKD